MGAPKKYIKKTTIVFSMEYDEFQALNKIAHFYQTDRNSILRIGLLNNIRAAYEMGLIAPKIEDAELKGRIRQALRIGD